MGQNLRLIFNRVGAFVALYGLWLIVVLLWTVLSFYLHRTLLVVGLGVIQTPSLRPTGWSTDTLTGIDRCGYLILGAVWLGMVLYTEGYLREGMEEGTLLVRTGRLLMIIITLFGLGFGLTFLAT